MPSLRNTLLENMALVSCSEIRRLHVFASVENDPYTKTHSVAVGSPQGNEELVTLAPKRKVLRDDDIYVAYTQQTSTPSTSCAWLSEGNTCAWKKGRKISTKNHRSFLEESRKMKPIEEVKGTRKSKGERDRDRDRG